MFQPLVTGQDGSVGKATGSLSHPDSYSKVIGG